MPRNFVPQGWRMKIPALPLVTPLRRTDWPPQRNVLKYAMQNVCVESSLN